MTYLTGVQTVNAQEPWPVPVGTEGSCSDLVTDTLSLLRSQVDTVHTPLIPVDYP
jgi:hypothetical protein